MPAVPARPASLSELADQCVKCGLCLPHCPTYQRDRVESAGPRGRIGLMKALESGVFESRPALQRLDECLGCQRCEQVCPAKVSYGVMIDAARSRWLPPRGLARWLLVMLAWPRMLRALLVLLPRRWHIGPAWVRRFQRGRARTAATSLPTPLPNAEVVLLPGCSGLILERAAVDALMMLASAARFELRIAAARCCGALHRHSGDPAQARRLGSVQAGELRTGASLYLGWATGCQRQLLDLVPAGAVMQSVLGWAAREVVPRLEFRLEQPERIGLWNPCTLTTQVHEGECLQQMLSRVDHLEVCVLRALACCGAAGMRHLLADPAIDVLTDAVLDEALAQGCVRLVTANPGCAHALRARAVERRLALPVVHVFEYLLACRASRTAPIALHAVESQ